MSRQNWYKKRSSHKRRQVDEELAVELVLDLRRLHPRMGVRKLHRLLKPRFVRQGVHMGRDRLFEVLRKNRLLIKPRSKHCRTTNPNHRLRVFPNRIKDMAITAPNQVWVGDITYIRTEESFVYLALLTDAYSRKIVGYHCGNSLEAIGCIRALDQALAEMPEGASPIHHSDRGCQYCCHEYISRLTSRGMSVSMTQTDHCAENAMAERVNGILKQEYALDSTFRNLQQAKVAVKQAVELSNNGRPHLNLGMRMPEQVHREAA